MRIAGDDETIANTYRTGLVSDPGAAHDYAHTWWMRDRLDQAGGHHDNQVLWSGPTPLAGDVRRPTEALLAMDRWLTRIKRDDSRP